MSWADCVHHLSVVLRQHLYGKWATGAVQCACFPPTSCGMHSSRLAIWGEMGMAGSCEILPCPIQIRCNIYNFHFNVYKYETLYCTNIIELCKRLQCPSTSATGEVRSNTRRARSLDTLSNAGRKRRSASSSESLFTLAYQAVTPLSPGVPLLVSQQGILWVIAIRYTCSGFASQRKSLVSSLSVSVQYCR